MNSHSAGAPSRGITVSTCIDPSLTDDKAIGDLTRAVELAIKKEDQHNKQVIKNTCLCAELPKKIRNRFVIAVCNNVVDFLKKQKTIPENEQREAFRLMTFATLGANTPDNTETLLTLIQIMHAFTKSQANLPEAMKLSAFFFYLINKEKPGMEKLNQEIYELIIKENQERLQTRLFEWYEE